MSSRLDPMRVAELQRSGFSVALMRDVGDAEYGWIHLSTPESQSDWKHRQPYRSTSAQAWVDCDAYARGVMPMQPDPDWNEKR